MTGLLLAVLLAAPTAAPLLEVKAEPAAGAYVVDTVTDFTFDWTARQALPEGTVIRLVSPITGGWSRVSFDPASDQREWQTGRSAKVTATLLKAPAGVTLKGEAAQWSERGPKYGAREPFRAIELTVTGGALGPGDSGRILIEKVKMSRESLLPDAARFELGYELFVKLAAEEQWREIGGLPRYRMLPAPPARLELNVRTHAVAGEPTHLSVVILDAKGNPAHDFRGQVLLTTDDPAVQLPATLEFGEADRGVKVVENLVFRTAGRRQITARSTVALPGGEAQTRPLEVLATAPALRHFWGELHNHGALSFDARNWGGCQMRPRDQYWWARNIENLDFAAVTDHSMHSNQMTQQNMTEAEFREVQEAAAERLEEGRFITLTAVEQRCARGDTNTYMARDDLPYYMKDKTLTVQEMWQFYAGAPILTIPHLHPLKKGNERFKEIDTTAERLIEIHSNHGRYEFHNNTPMLPGKGMVEGNNVQAILSWGHRLGFVCASDDHSGKAGSRDLTCVMAPELTRQAIFTALKERRCYGTTGEPILVDFRLGDQLFGSEIRLPAGDPRWTGRRFSAKVVGTTTLKSVEVIRNGQVVYSVQPDGPRAEFEFADTEPLDKCYLGTEAGYPPTVYYYLRVIQQPAGAPAEQNLHMAWTSPIYLSPAG